MSHPHINRKINLLLRSCGIRQPTAFAFDKEYLETYREGRYKVSKLTAEWGVTLFCVSQDGQVVYFSGDRRQDTCISGEWQDWLAEKISSSDH